MKALQSPWLAPLQTTTARLAQHWRASRLPVFLHWWRRELIACLPRRWRERLESSNQEHLLHWHEGALRHPAEYADSTATAPARRQVLLMPCEQVLLSRVQLPLEIGRAHV